MFFKMKSIKINQTEVGPGHPTYIIAEISCNHGGDFEIACQTVKAIAQSGANAVKLQTARPDFLTLDSDQKEFVIKGGTLWDGRTLFDLYCETQTPWDWHKPLQELTHSLGLDFFSSPFDLGAVDFLAKLDVPAYKIASFEAVDPYLIEAVASHGKPVIISTGIASESDVERALAACKNMGNDQVVLLKCTSAYPAPLEAANVLQIPALSRRFNCIVGLSDHTKGEMVALGSVAQGACIIEKHFILDRVMGGPDAEFSMNPEEFTKMIKTVRDMEKVLGDETLNLNSESSIKSRQFARSLFAIKDIAKGCAFTHQNVRSIRPGYGLPPKEMGRILGHPAKVKITRGTPLSWDMVK